MPSSWDGSRPSHRLPINHWKSLPEDDQKEPALGRRLRSAASQGNSLNAGKETVILRKTDSVNCVTEQKTNGKTARHWGDL